MNKLIGSLSPIMNTKEIDLLLQSHYENQSQTLTNLAQSNLLKYNEITNILTSQEKEQWQQIKSTFIKNTKLKVFGKEQSMQQLVKTLSDFGDHLQGIQETLKTAITRK